MAEERKVPVTCMEASMCRWGVKRPRMKSGASAQSLARQIQAASEKAITVHIAKRTGAVPAIRAVRAVKRRRDAAGGFNPRNRCPKCRPPRRGGARGA